MLTVINVTLGVALEEEVTVTKVTVKVASVKNWNVSYLNVVVAWTYTINLTPP